MNPRRRLVLVLGLVLAVREAGAESPRPGWLTAGVVVTDDQALFCQPDDSFTILDLRTGAPLVRDTEARREGRLRLTEHGLLRATVPVAEAAPPQRRWRPSEAALAGVPYPAPVVLDPAPMREAPTLTAKP
jgi:hypothetical protein